MAPTFPANLDPVSAEGFPCAAQSLSRRRFQVRVLDTLLALDPEPTVGPPGRAFIRLATYTEISLTYRNSGLHREWITSCCHVPRGRGRGS